MTTKRKPTRAKPTGRWFRAKVSPSFYAYAETYARHREMTLDAFVVYCVRLYMDTTPETDQ